MAVARWWNPWKPLVCLPTHHALASHSGGAHCNCERRECSASGGSSSQAEPWIVDGMSGFEGLSLPISGSETKELFCSHMLVTLYMN